MKGEGYFLVRGNEVCCVVGKPQAGAPGFNEDSSVQGSSMDLKP